MNDTGMIEEYEPSLPEKVMKSMTGSTQSNSLDNDDVHI
jgi:hypothetical protein